jgi:adenylate cyclase
VKSNIGDSEIVEYTIRFEPSGRSIRVPAGTTLLQAVRNADLPIAAACGEHGLCARCGLEILEGAEDLPAEPPEEQKTKLQNRIEAKLRLSCHLKVQGDLVVTATYW